MNYICVGAFVERYSDVRQDYLCTKMNKKDFRSAVIIGAAVGILSQFVIANFAASLIGAFALPISVVRLVFFLFFLILAPLLLFVASLIGKIIPVLYQFAKFAAVGSLNSVVDLGVFNLETLLLGQLPTDIVFIGFKTVSFLAATTNSYFWNKYWTFESNERIHSGEVAKFYTVAIVGGLINVGAATLTKISGPAYVSGNFWVNIVSPVVGIFAALLWDFVGYKFFVFKNSPDLPINKQDKRQ